MRVVPTESAEALCPSPYGVAWRGGARLSEILKRLAESRNDTRIDDAIDAVLEGTLAIGVFPPLEAVKHNGGVFAVCGNRRLLLFRVLAAMDVVSTL